MVTSLKQESTQGEDKTLCKSTTVYLRGNQRLTARDHYPRPTSGTTTQDQPQGPLPKTNLIYQTSKQEAITDQKCIAFQGAIMRLIRLAVGATCSQCCAPLTFTTTMCATCMMVKWRCPHLERHVHGCWSSQPNLLGMKAGNLLVPVCHVLAGNSYVKTALFAKCLEARIRWGSKLLSVGTIMTVSMK